MAHYQSRSAARRQSPPPRELTEAKLTIPDALITWAQDTDRQLAWTRPLGQEVAALVQAAQEAPLLPDATERLLSRLDAIVSQALTEGRSDLLVGFDLQTAEWLGLHIHAETSRGHLHIGPDPRTQAFEGRPEPPWTYSEIRVVYDAKERAAVDLAWQAKELLLEAFPTSRMVSLEFDKPLPICPACGKAAGSVMLATDGGEYHPRCWSELIAPMPEHLQKLLKKNKR